MEQAIIEQNSWWKDKENLLSDEKIATALNKNPPLVYNFEDYSNNLFIGPRQVGKTTFFKLLIYDLLFNKRINPKEVCYFSCELLKNFKDLIELFRKFSVLANPKYIFLDEISFVEDWHRAVKYLLDSGLLKGKILYLTGSSSVELKKERFPGRGINIKYFLPLSFRKFAFLFGSEKLKTKMKDLKISEFRNLKEIYEKSKELFTFEDELEKLFFIYLQAGGFPRAFYEMMEEGRIKSETYEIYWNWLLNDIAKLGRSEKIATSILEGILKNYGVKFSLNSIAKEMEIGSHVTVREYLEIFENLLAVRNVHFFDFNKKMVIFRKMRKVYFIDPFILHTINFRIYGTKYEDFPKMVEGLVTESLIRKFGSLKLGFYTNRREIDVAFNNFGIEVKWQEKVTSEDFPKTFIKNKIIISKKDFDFVKDENLLILPASLFLALVDV